MKYFTREELEDITRELLENPARETLKRLNEKYNETSEEENNLVKTVENISIEPPVVEEPQTVNQVQNLNIPSVEVPKTENIVNNNPSIEVPSFELPKLETPVYNNQNNNPVTFTGNLWETPKTEINNLMQTTDNFGVNQAIMPTTEVPVNGVPFFGPNQEQVNNSIPVSSIPVQQGPTMFGQFEQNYI